MNPLIRAAATLLVCLVAAGAQAQTAFYEAAPAELPGLPGSIIRSERMAFGPIGGDAWRLLYRSTDPGGRPIAVSGVVVLPHGATPPGGRPIVAWGHPTTGVVPACAPSLAHFVFQQMSGLRQFIDAGYIVAATDYPGLGTPGPHPFLDGASEGRAVLDMIRATKAFLGPQAGSRAALWGHSQGGQAVLFAAELAPHYAPELDLAGVAAAAPATDLAALMHDDLGTGGGDNLLAMTLWSWSRLHDLPLAGVVIPSAVPAMDALADICLESPVDILPRRSLGEQLEKGFLADPDFIDREPWRRLLAANTIGGLPPSLPVFLAQGTDDDTVRPAVTAGFARRLCAAGSRVVLLPLPGVGHGLAAHDAAPALAEWLAGRFADRPAPDECSALPPL